MSAALFFSAQLPGVNIGIVQVAVVDKDAFIADPEDAVSGSVGVLKRGDFAVIELFPQFFFFSGFFGEIFIGIIDLRFEVELIFGITHGGVDYQLIDAAAVGRIDIFDPRNFMRMTAQNDGVTLFQKIE